MNELVASWMDRLQLISVIVCLPSTRRPSLVRSSLLPRQHFSPPWRQSCLGQQLLTIMNMTALSASLLTQRSPAH